MTITTIDEIGRHVAADVEVRGWVYNLRSSGAIHFLLLRDGTGILQAVAARQDLPAEVFEAIGALTQESSVIAGGIVREDRRAPGGYELGLRRLAVVQTAAPYPLTPKEHGVEFLMDHRHLWLRSSRPRAIMRVRAEVERAICDYLDERGYVRMDTPILTPSACEGTSTLFETPYFERRAYLAQSGQLYNEANAVALGRVYCFGPTFRAEKSKTRRHLTEFWMVEPEAAFLDLEGCIQLAEGMVVFIVQRVLERRRKDLETLERDIGALERVLPPFPRLTYDEAVALLKAQGHPAEWGEDFGGDEETALGLRYDRPVFVHRYPTQCKAFYMQPAPDRPEVVLGADLLASEGYGEIIGGGQRIHDPDLLEQRLREARLPREEYAWYLDLRRYGSVPHSGFGIGIERTVAWICHLDHVRETIPFPRLINRLYP
ncbi:MAG: asparagine--tRNA ligase [Bacillati bacterium ANGP1]|uniref:Asparagine--tRNA ligase n=1 Tax=Candidatus Segetimicrobium genomatis TaxID=2569760 RepID=A0A537JD54_9BACT|nr:MAG: asparagine--tRNA ligase [Terrabacteria group bacterium ANGP1]